MTKRIPIGDLLSRTFDLYGSNAAGLIQVAAVIWLIPAILDAVLVLVTDNVDSLSGAGLAIFASFATSVCAISSTVGAKPRLPASLATFLARASAVPVWEPKRMVSGASAAAFEISDFRFEIPAPGARENTPARKPFSQARCSGVKGAVSGMSGTGFIGEVVSSGERLVSRVGSKVHGL